MAWYDILIILVIIFGIILFILGSRRKRRWGMILVLISLIVKASLWIAGV
jgi:hypothetical protein